MTQENFDPFSQFESENNTKNERTFSIEEQGIIDSFRQNQAQLQDIMFAADDIDGYLKIPEAFKDSLLTKYPDFAKRDEEVNLNEYEKYAMWHFLAGSSPRVSATKFDFPEGDSVQEYMQSLLDEAVAKKEVDKS